MTWSTSPESFTPASRFIIDSVRSHKANRAISAPSSRPGRPASCHLPAEQADQHGRDESTDRAFDGFPGDRKRPSPYRRPTAQEPMSVATIIRQADNVISRPLSKPRRLSQWQAKQVEQSEDRCRNVGDGTRHRLQQQPTADGGSRRAVQHALHQPVARLGRPQVVNSSSWQTTRVVLVAGRIPWFAPSGRTRAGQVHHSPERGGEHHPQAHHQRPKPPTPRPLINRAQRCSGRWHLALIEDNLTDHADRRSPEFTLSIADGRDLET